MLKLYTDQSLLTEQHRGYIFPLLLDVFYKKCEIMMEYFKLVESMEQADVLVLPLDYNYFIKHSNSNISEYLIFANKNQKPFWVYTAGDFGFSLNHQNTYVFRSGGFHSKLNSRTFIIPSFVGDPYKLNGIYGFTILPKDEKPKIGFVGHANSSGLKLVKEIASFFNVNIRRVFGRFKLDYQSFYPSAIKRFGYLNDFMNNKDVSTDFILRKKYRAGAVTPTQRKISETEFKDNMYNNPYIFCMRGVGNFSVRFYETIAMGRIPVLLDTDCRLPLMDVIDWENHIVYIKPPLHVESLVNFHESITESDFEQMQIRNRNLYLDKLNRKKYFIQIHNQFIRINL